MKTCNEVVNGKLGSSRPCRLLASSYTLIITYTACFVSKPHQVKCEFNSGSYEQQLFLLASASVSLSCTPFESVCAHVCICQSAETPWGNWTFATPHPLSPHKCEGIVNISAADGADAPSLPSSHTQGVQSKWIAINSSRSRPRPRLE